MPRKNPHLQELKCDLCPFTTKNNHIYKRHRIRCRREDAIRKREGIFQDVATIPGTAEVGLNEDDHNTMESSSSVDSTPTPLLPLVEDSATNEPEAAEESSSESEDADAGDDADGEPSASNKEKPKVRRNYTCAKCGMQTRKSKKFLYHLVEVHHSSTDIFACRVCEYCSRYRHKIQRHMKFAHKLDVAYNDIEPEHAGVGRRKVSVSSKVAKPVKMKSFAGRKLTVKFTKPQSSGGASGSVGLPAPVEQGQKLNVATATANQSLDQLSRVVEQVVLEEGQTIYKCKECQFMNEDKLKVARHAVSWHVDTKSFTCSHCDYISFDRNDFLAHRITHRNEHQFRCDECTYSTDFRPNYDRHMNNHRNSFPFKCSFCSYGCGSDAAVRRHMASNHDPVPPPQKKLKLPVPKSVSAAAHTATVKKNTSSHTSPIKPRTDTPPPPSSQSQTAASSEISQSEDPMEDLEESAEDLLLQFNKSSLFDTNSASMVPRPVIPLPEGIEMNERELSPHRKICSSVLKYVERDNGKLVCPVCKLKYKRSSDLNRHMKRKHDCRLRDYLEQDMVLKLESGINVNGISDIEDDDAGNAEDDGEDDLNDDYVVGNVGSGPDSAGDDEPLVSAEQLQCQFCDFQAKWPSDLKRHTAVHSIEKRYECNLCSKKYKYLGDMNVHIRKDHKVEPERMKILRVPTVAKKNSSPALFKCAGCDYTSTWKSEVDRHSQMHTGEKKFQCANCDYQTYWRGDIRRHIYRHHPGVMAEGVAIDDVITVRKGKSPVTPTKLQNAEMAVGETSGDWSSDYTTPMSTPDKSREGTADAFQGSGAAAVPHSPSPSPIKEIGGGQYECQYCGFVASAPSKMNSHIATHTNLKRYKCPLCGRRANWKWDIAKHLRTDHPGQDAKVVKLSKQEAERTIHAYIEENPTVKREHHLNMMPKKSKLSSETFQQYFKCSHCDFSAENRISVARHIRYMHKGEETQILMVRKHIPKKKQTQVQTGNLVTSAFTPEDNLALNSIKFQPNANSTPTQNMTGVESAGQQDASRPFMCSECGKRGATKGDVKKHYHYLHADKEIRIIYLGDGSQSVYSPKADIRSIPTSAVSPLATQQPYLVPLTPQASPAVTPQASPSGVVAQDSPVIVYAGNMSTPKSAVPSPSPTRSPSQSPAKSGDGSRQPKVLGYIKPFKCGMCGRRSNWRWDMSKHIRERHPGMNVEVITLSEAEARATVESYMANELPVLNKTSNSVPRRSPEKSPVVIGHPKAIAPAQPTFSAITPPKIISPKATFGTGVPSKGEFRQFMCSACPYRSNWRADITRHIARRHSMVSHARLIMLDKETAAATLEAYDYKRGHKRRNVGNPQKDAVRPQTNTGIGVTVSNGMGNNGPYEVRSPTLEGPLPKKAWAGLEKKMWKCSLCPYTNPDKVDCLRHLAKHNMKAYKCTVCNWTSNFRSGVYRHIQIKHVGDSMACCRLCIKLIKEGPGLDESGQSIVPTEAMPSGRVDNQTSQEMVKGETAQESAPVAHKFAVPGKVPAMDMALTVMYHCKLCLFKSKWRSCVCRHVRKLHNSKDFRINCVKKIVRGATSAQVPSHAAHTARRSVLESPTNVGTVEKVKARNFACNICPYRTYKARMLKFHMTCHTPQPGVKQAKCKFCPYYVNGGRLLAQHMNLHLTEYREKPTDKATSYPLTPVKSKTKIVARSPQSPAIKRHRCEKCPYTTNSKNDYLYHKQFHRPKPTADFKCDYCDYWVAHRRLIKQHMKVHEEDQGNSSSNFSEAPTPTKSEYSDTSILYDAVEFAAAKQRIIASKITPSISQSPLVSPMKIASSCSMGGKRGFLRKDGSYRKIHRCRHCPYMNIRLRNLKLHELMHGKRSASHPLMKCPHCDYFVGSKGLLGHHLKVHQPNYDVDMLGFDDNKMENGTSEDSEVDGNISMESKVDSLLEIARFKKYGCEKCPYGTSKRAHFQRHIELHGSKQKCKCDFCDYSVPTMNLLNQHTRLHFEPNQNLLAAQSILNLQRLPEMPADVALASMMANNDSKHPISVTHDNVDLYENAPEDMLPKKLYRCDRCPYANVRRDHLLAHLRCHMIKNEFACPYCDYSVMKIHVLMQHVKVHFSPLPEFCEWLTENGDPARMREVKEKDMREAIDVVRMFQREKDKETVEVQVGGDAEVKKKEENKKVAFPSGSDDGEKKDEVKMETDDDKANNPESEKGEATDTKPDEGGAKMEIDEDVKDEVEGNVAETRNGDDGAAVETNVSKMDGTELSNGSSTGSGEAGDGVNGQTDSYVCQYCDRDFKTSDCLVRHEMQHLIGNNYEEVVQQLIQQVDPDPDVIVVEDDSLADTCQSNPPSQVRLDPDGSDQSSSMAQQSSDSAGAVKPPSFELHSEADKDKASDDKSVIDISTGDDQSDGDGQEKSKDKHDVDNVGELNQVDKNDKVVQKVTEVEQVLDPELNTVVSKSTEDSKMAKKNENEFKSSVKKSDVSEEVGEHKENDTKVEDERTSNKTEKDIESNSDKTENKSMSCDKNVTKKCTSTDDGKVANKDDEGNITVEVQNDLEGNTDGSGKGKEAVVMEVDSDTGDVDATNNMEKKGLEDKTTDAGTAGDDTDSGDLEDSENGETVIKDINAAEEIQMETD